MDLCSVTRDSMREYNSSHFQSAPVFQVDQFSLGTTAKKGHSVANLSAEIPKIIAFFCREL